MRRLLSCLLLFTFAIILTFEAAQAAFAPGTDDLSFTTFLEPPVNYTGWIVLGAFALVSIVGIVLSGGTASPAVTAVGSWIGGMAGYSGAAATSYGLALMGGGSLAAGGGGAALGAVVIGSILTVGADVSGHLAKLTYEEIKTSLEVEVTVPGLPYPTNADSDPRLQQSIDFIDAAYAFKNVKRAPNLKPDYADRIYSTALDMLTVPSDMAYTSAQLARLNNTRAIIHYNLRDYDASALAAQKAIASAIGIFEVDRFKVDTPTNMIAALRKSKEKTVKIGAPASVWLLARAAAKTVSIEDAMTMFELISKSEKQHDWLPVVAFPLADLLSRSHPETATDLVLRLRKITNDTIASEKLRAQTEAITAVRTLIELERLRRDAAHGLCASKPKSTDDQLSFVQANHQRAQRAYAAAGEATSFLKKHHRGLLWDGEQFDIATRMEQQRKKYATPMKQLATIVLGKDEVARSTFCSSVTAFAAK